MKRGSAIAREKRGANHSLVQVSLTLAVEH